MSMHCSLDELRLGTTRSGAVGKSLVFQKLVSAGFEEGAGGFYPSHSAGG